MKKRVPTNERLYRTLSDFGGAFYYVKHVLPSASFPRLILPENQNRWSVRFNTDYGNRINVTVSPFEPVGTESLQYNIEQIGAYVFTYKDDPVLTTAAWHGQFSFGFGNVVIVEQLVRG